MGRLKEKEYMKEVGVIRSLEDEVLSTERSIRQEKATVPALLLTLLTVYTIPMPLSKLANLDFCLLEFILIYC